MLIILESLPAEQTFSWLRRVEPAGVTAPAPEPRDRPNLWAGVAVGGFVGVFVAFIGLLNNLPF